MHFPKLRNIFLYLLLFISLFIHSFVSHAEDQRWSNPSVSRDRLYDGPESIYKVAVELYKRGDYQKAKEKFQRVAQLKFQYKATPQFLERIEQHLSSEPMIKKPEHQEVVVIEEEGNDLREPVDRSLRIEETLLQEARRKEDLKKELQRQKKIAKVESQKKIARARKILKREKVKKEKLAKKKEQELINETRKKRAKLERARLKKQKEALKKAEEEKKLLAEIRKREEMRYEKQQEFARLLERKRAELQKKKESWKSSFSEREEKKAPNTSEITKPSSKPEIIQVAAKSSDPGTTPLDVDIAVRRSQSVNRINEITGQLEKAFSSKRYDLAEDYIKRIDGSLASQDLPESFEKRTYEQIGYYTRRINLARKKEALLRPETAKVEKTVKKHEVSIVQVSSKPVEAVARPLVVTPNSADKGSLAAKEKEELLKERKHQRRKELLAEVDTLYKKGVHYYKNGDFEAAGQIFTEVDYAWPEYKLTRRYLNIVQEEKTNKKVLQKTLDVTAKKIPKSRERIVAEALDEAENKL